MAWAYMSSSFKATMSGLSDPKFGGLRFTFATSNGEMRLALLIFLGPKGIGIVAAPSVGEGRGPNQN
ncbi:hypothetical protein L1049_006125 [Liquidambar formosana]|uniref:Uncharacterized protein n=1 Tax=Liquidambar formosana TaxID=63359 RepID=A0AAP0RGP8_LIQFO